MPSTFELLEAVHDHETFVAFVIALAAEREAAATIEADNSKRHTLDGAHGWANADIPAFLEASCEFFAAVPDGEPVPEPSVSAPQERRPPEESPSVIPMKSNQWQLGASPPQCVTNPGRTRQLTVSQGTTGPLWRCQFDHRNQFDLPFACDPHGVSCKTTTPDGCEHFE